MRLFKKSLQDKRHSINMAKRDLSDAIFEVKDTQRSARSASKASTLRPKDPSLFKRRAFDTFYLFGFALLVLAIVIQVVALVAYS